MDTKMTGTVELIGRMAFDANSASGHTFTLDAGRDVGGEDTGPRPMEAVLLALGACTGMDVISILRKMRQDVSGYRINLNADRREEHPRVFTAIDVEHVVRGRNLDVEAVRRAIDLSARRYCSVGIMLGKSVALTERYTIVDDATGNETTGGHVAAA